jgi:hypothetical protein
VPDPRPTQSVQASSINEQLRFPQHDNSRNKTARIHTQTARALRLVEIVIRRT